MEVKAVIFDMDGVIFDSENAVFRCWQEISAKHGLRDVEIPYMRTVGMNNDATKLVYLDFYGSDYPYDEYRLEQSKLYHSLYDGGRLPLKPGIRELLEYLNENNCYTAVASSTRSALVNTELRDAGLLQYFDRIVGGDMVSRSKPAPDVFLKAAENCGFENSEIYVIEDSFNGIRAAKAAGMIPVMVPDLLQPDAEMRSIAAYIFDSLSDFRGFCAGL